MKKIKMEFPVNIKVKAGMPKTEITGEEDGVYSVNVHAKAEDNKANIELVNFFSRLAGKRVRILKVVKSKRKVIG